MRKNDLDFFLRYCSKSSCYFEWGTGLTTSISSSLVKKKIYTIDSNQKYQSGVIERNNLLSDYVKTQKVVCLNIGNSLELHSSGKPVSKINETKSEFLSRVEPYWNKYVSPFQNFKEVEFSEIDLVLIDGRSRVCCALTCFKYLNNEVTVMIHDAYIRGNDYTFVENYYNVYDSNFPLLGESLREHDQYFRRDWQVKKKDGVYSSPEAYVRELIDGYGFITLKKRNVTPPSDKIIKKYMYKWR